MRMPGHVASGVAYAARWREYLLDLLFPTRCVSCGRIGEAICSSCLLSVRLVSPPLCPRCGRAQTSKIELCNPCRVRPLHLDQIRSVAFHEGALRQAIHSLKYDRRSDVATPLAALLVEYLMCHPIQVDLITAVPLHLERERTRGYNQAEVLARGLAMRTGLPFVPSLERTRFTSDQIGLDTAARFENVRGAFLADSSTVCGKRVLIIDDVCTTGATLDQCAVALRAIGARTIFGLTVTRPR